MKIAAVIAVHERYDITLKTILRLKNQSPELKHIIIIGSSESEKTLAYLTGSIFISSANKPLGKKWQKGIYVAKDLNCDGVMILGSDDWITDNWIRTCVNKANEGYELIGKREFHFLKISKNGVKLGLWKGYPVNDLRHMEPIGAGRIFMRTLLDRLQWKIFPDYLDSGLDKASYFLAIAHNAKIDLLDNTHNYILDIKSTFWKNKWSFDQLVDSNNTQNLHDPYSFLDKYFPDAREWINNLINLHIKNDKK